MSRIFLLGVPESPLKGRHGPQDGGPGFEQRRVALLRLEPCYHADDLGPGLHAVFLGERAARLGVVVAR